MNYKDFLDKYHLRDENAQFDVHSLVGWLSMMDYFYCSLTKEQMLQLTSEFYDNADDIFNSLQEELQQAMEAIAAELENMAANNELPPDNYTHEA